MSILSCRNGLVALLAVGAAQPVAAQQVWAPFIGLSSAPTGPLSPASSSLILAPGARLETSRASVLAQWGTTFEQSTPRFDNADLSARTTLTRSPRFESALTASGQYDRGYLIGGASSNAKARIQVGSTSPARGLQLGVGVDSWRSSTSSIAAPATTLSAWIRRFGLSFSAEVSGRQIGIERNPGDTGFVTVDSARLRQMLASGQSVDSMPLTRIYSSPGIRNFGEGRFRVSGAIMSIGIDGEAGSTLATGGGSRTFGSLILTRWLTPSFALTGGVILQPTVPGVAQRRGALLGIRLANGPRLLPRLINAPKPAAATCSVRYGDADATVEVEAPGASHVEISGDFTRWRPVILERKSGDRWAATAAITPGVHHVVVRVDGGEWAPPPGLPQAVDLYEGTVGVIVAPERPLTPQH